ncbi:uncharacterized protein SOCG_05147 [Schizosaccharomyces octosporus yFS286]|uniref:Uncharacterized protein n=1 Tax=Schizosaccharomyces octosporus (strain yFS286) TaxID=483514 RepID=S9Q3K2_SCHOY|nr:uncharacterized protein SOCG_05147 [Schizosaccharomyces octosporus yFS286]EPX74248.1 hypothetical protein SOCG_05147 [Schizosaccharomyces octosporus yFS286]
MRKQLLYKRKNEFKTLERTIRKWEFGFQVGKLVLKSFNPFPSRFILPNQRFTSFLNISISPPLSLFLSPFPSVYLPYLVSDVASSLRYSFVYLGTCAASVGSVMCIENRLLVRANSL